MHVASVFRAFCETDISSSAKKSAKGSIKQLQSLAQRGRTAEDTTAATAWLAAAFEIVGSRMANWDIKFVDIVTDNASSGLFVRGREQRYVATIDLVNCMMRMMRDGQEVSRGSGTLHGQSAERG